jgi:hypothetical protein
LFIRDQSAMRQALETAEALETIEKSVAFIAERSAAAE